MHESRQDGSVGSSKGLQKDPEGLLPILTVTSYF